MMANKIALPNLEVHVSHARNLRCRGCSHYSNFGMSGNLSTDQAELWFSTWAAKVWPREFALLGGEPTMNPALSEIVQLASRYWRESRLLLVTNGLLLQRHPDLLPILRDTQTTLEISVHFRDQDYSDRIAKLRDYLDPWSKSVHIHWRNACVTWSTRYVWDADNPEAFHSSDAGRAWRACAIKQCRQLHDNHLWKCPLIAYLQPLVDLGVGPVALRKYLDYQPLPPSATADEIGRWLAIGAESCCEMCPERREAMTP